MALGGVGMHIFKDRHGKTWITAEGILRYFGIKIHEYAKRYFYNYDFFLKVLR